MEQYSNIDPQRQAVGQDDTIMIRNVFETFVINWKWFVLSVIVCTCAAWLYIKKQQPVYQRQAAMMVKDDSNGMSGSRGGTDALMQLNGIVAGTNVQNEMFILQSHQLMMDVVKRMNLQTFYTLHGRFHDTSLYDVRPFTLKPDTACAETFSFEVKMRDDKTMIISDLTDGKEKYDFTGKVQYDKPIKTPVGTFVLETVKGDTTDWAGSTLTVAKVTTDMAANAYQGRVSAAPIDKMSTLVQLTCHDTNLKRAEDLLSTVLESYRRSIVDDKNQVAESTARFIDERLKVINEELSGIESNLARFKRDNRLVDVQANASAYMSQSQNAMQKIYDLESQMAVSRFLQEFLKDASKRDDLIPAVGGLTDHAIQQQMSEYNALMLQRNKLMGSSTTSTPKMLELTASMDKLRAGILASMEGYLRSLGVQLAAAQKVERGMDSQLQSMPAKEREALDITRQQKIKETLYTFMLNKREETALQLAITEANIRIVEHPYGSDTPVSPKRLRIMAIGLALGLALPFAIFYIISMFNIKVRGRGDIEAYTTIPIIGEIPHRKGGMKDDEILVGANKTDTLTEAFRMLRYSLEFINKDARVIMFTSTTPSEGKTLVSRNLSVTIGMAGKSVVLIDADIRKRTQSKVSGMAKLNGLTSYLSGAVDNVDEIIIPKTDHTHFDIMPAGFAAPNPAELLMSKRLEQLMEELKKKYDYIIVDNVPAQVVADASIVNRIAELTIYVMREGHIDRRYLPELERMHQEKRFNNLCLVLNDCDTEKKRYGYGYGYGYGHYYYGGYYGYGYTDANRRKKKKSNSKFKFWKS